MSDADSLAEASVPPDVPLPSPAPKRRRVKAEVSAEKAPEDPKAKQEKTWLASWRDWLEKLADEKTARVASLYIDMALRFLMACLFFWLTRSWLLGVLELLGKQTEAKTLQDSVLIALLTTTTINVLALLTAVAVYLFPRKAQATTPHLDPNVPPPPA